MFMYLYVQIEVSIADMNIHITLMTWHDMTCYIKFYSQGVCAYVLICVSPLTYSNDLRVFERYVQCYSFFEHVFILKCSCPAFHKRHKFELYTNMHNTTVRIFHISCLHMEQINVDLLDFYKRDVRTHVYLILTSDLFRQSLTLSVFASITKLINRFQIQFYFYIDQTCT